ncbi:MAG: 4Fe-4S binding protein [Planctomycetota bacterium]
MNLFKIVWLKRVAQSKWFPLWPQCAMLAILCLLIWGGLGVSTNDSTFAKTLRNTNLANLIVWSYWWPLIIITTIVIGRIWCTVCPMELLTAITSRIGLKRQAPSWFRSGWIITSFYVLIILVGLHTLAIHRQPHRMSLYLLLLLVTSITVSLIFEKRAFCSYICPVGHLLGLYSLLSPFEWRADDLGTCEACMTKDCIAKKNHYRMVGRSCTSNLYPAKIEDNRDCLLCTQCLKACPYKNLRFSLRKPGANLYRHVEFTPAQMVFLFVAAAFVIYEILSEWSSSKAVLIWVPVKLGEILGMHGAIGSFMSASVMFVLYPAVFLLGIYLLGLLLCKTSFREMSMMLCVLLIPTIAAAHVLKSLLKMVSRIPYWQYVFSDPRGISTAMKISNMNQSIPKAMYSVQSYTSIFLMSFAFVAMVFLLRRSVLFRSYNRKGKVLLFCGAIAYWGVFAVTIILWRF